MPAVQICDITPCPACLNTQFRFLFEKKGRHFYRCIKCGSEKQYPLPSLEELKSYYDQSYGTGMYKEFSDAALMKSMTARKRWQEIKKFVSRSGRWLDVGCGNGVFVEHLRSHGIDASGIELSEVAVAEAKKRGLAVSAATIEDYRPEFTYQTISCFDIIEHVLDPFSFLREVHRLLAPGGTVILSLPDHGSIFRKIMGPRWFFYIPEEHLHYFNHSNIRLLMTRSGFCTKLTGMAFKPLTYNYSLTQFKEYNPLIFSGMSLLGKVIPAKLKDTVIPLYIGEMKVIAESI